MEIIDVFGSEHYVQLEEAERSLHELITKRDELLESGFVSAEIEAAYVAAIEALENKLSLLASNPELQALVAQLGIEGITGVQQVEPLESVLQPEEYMDLKGSFYSRMFRAAAFFEKYGPVGPDAEKFLRKVAAGGYPVSQVAIDTVQEPVELTPEVSPEVTQAKREIDVKIGVTSIKVGGRMISYDNRRGRTDQTDYSQPRKNALLYMLAQPEDALVTARDLKIASFGETVDTNTFAQVRGWLFSLTHNRTPLFVSNGKNNQTIRYMVNPRFKVNPIFSERFRGGVIEPPTADETLEPTEEALEAHGVRQGDIFLTAYKLQQFNFMFDEIGLPQIPGELINELQSSAPDLSSLKGKETELERVREEAFERVVEFLESPGLFEFIDSIDRNPENRPAEYKFLECFLTTLDDNQMKLVKKLLTARTLPMKVTGRLQIMAAPTKTVIAKDGTVLYPLPEINSEGYIVWGKDEIRLKVRDAEPELNETHETEVDVAGQLEDGDIVALRPDEEADEGSKTEGESEAQPESTSEGPRKTKAERNYEVAQAEVEHFIDGLIAKKMSPTSSYDIGQIVNLVPDNMKSQYTPSMIRRAMHGDSPRTKGTPILIDMEKLVALKIERIPKDKLSKKDRKVLQTEAVAYIRSIA